MNGVLKIKKTYTGFSGKINTGKYSLFIELDDNGIDITADQLVSMIVNYNNVIVKSVNGQEPMEQSAELSKIMKTAINQNRNLHFEIHTLGIKKPLSFNKSDNIKFIVNIQLKNSGKNFKERVEPKALKWMIDTESVFVFYITNKNDLDEANLIINDYGIQKSKIYLIPFSLENDILELVKEFAKTMGCNITLDFDKILWN